MSILNVTRLSQRIDPVDLLPGTIGLTLLHHQKRPSTPKHSRNDFIVASLSSMASGKACVEESPNNSQEEQKMHQKKSENNPFHVFDC
jgi:hypothetical protein